MKLKKTISLLVAATLLITMSACKKDGTSSDDLQATTENGKAASVEEEERSIDSLVLGETGGDLEATIKVLTHRTDIIDTVFSEYVSEFQNLYPGITIEYEGITDYMQDITTRLTTDNWGDICMIPTTVDKNELPNLFASYGQKSVLDQEYVMLNNFAFENQVYGIPSTGNAQGIVYNKKVFEQAGIAEIPKTPDEFLTALQKIKDNCENVIPMYSNFAAGWTMSAWDAYITGSATGDPEFTNTGLVHGKNPFAKQESMTGPYAVYYVLYEAVARGLTEDDPTTTDWEGSKGMINRGEIGTMVLGSWAVTQMQEAGEHAEDIGYMPFPITVNEKQYATAGPDYCFGINKNSSSDNKLASMLYVKWLTEQSNFAYDQGGVPICVGAEYPSVLDAFEGVDLVIDNPAPAGEETFYNDINNDSEIGLNADPTPKNAILEYALERSMTLDEIMDEWNRKWSASQEKYGVEVVE